MLSNVLECVRNVLECVRNVLGVKCVRNDCLDVIRNGITEDRLLVLRRGACFVPRALAGPGAPRMPSDDRIYSYPGR